MENTNRKTLVMKDGTTVSPLYIQNLSEGDWELLYKVKQTHNILTVADTVRFIIRQMANKL